MKSQARSTQLRTTDTIDVKMNTLVALLSNCEKFLVEELAKMVKNFHLRMFKT